MVHVKAGGQALHVWTPRAGEQIPSRTIFAGCRNLVPDVRFVVDQARWQKEQKRKEASDGKAR